MAITKATHVPPPLSRGSLRLYFGPQLDCNCLWHFPRHLLVTGVSVIDFVIMVSRFVNVIKKYLDVINLKTYIHTECSVNPSNFIEQMQVMYLKQERNKHSMRWIFLERARPRLPQNAPMLSDKLNKFYNQQQSSRSR